VARLLEGLNVHDLAELARRGLAIRQAVASAEMPGDLQDQIADAYVT
jgi:phosphoenolpyruvate synthase/pyruvate phosphate dikinase